MLPYAAKCQGYSFYRFWVIKGKQTGDKIHTHTHSHTHSLGLIKSQDLEKIQEE